MKNLIKVALLPLTLLLLQGCGRGDDQKAALKAVLDNCEGDVGVSMMIKSNDLENPRLLLTCSKTSQSMVNTIIRNVQ
jgi:hypothetical protein